MSEFVTVMTTTGSADEARRIAHTLVERRLAGCVQMTAVESCYRWDGKVRIDPEHLLLVKTRAELADAVEQAIRAAHSYEVPEVLVLPVLGGSADYLAWLAAETERPFSQRKPPRPAPSGS